MGGVAEGVEEGHHILRQALVNDNHVALGNADVLAEGAVPVHAHALGVLAPLDVAGVAVAAAAAGDVPLAADPLADVQPVDARAQLGDFAHIFMADDHGRTDMLHRPGVPVINMYVRTADGGFVDLDEYLSGTRLGNRNLPQFQTYSCNRLYQRVHELCHNRPPIKYIIRLFGSPYVDSIRLARPVVNTKFEKFFARITPPQTGRGPLPSRKRPGLCVSKNAPHLF